MPLPTRIRGCNCVVVIYKSIILEPPEENAKTGPPLVSEKHSRRRRGFEPEQYRRLRSRRLLGLVLVFLFFFSFWSFILGLTFSFFESSFAPCLSRACLLGTPPPPLAPQENYHRYYGFGPRGRYCAQGAGKQGLCSA